MFVMFIFTTIFHAHFARFGHFFRYEAYLIGIGFVPTILTIYEWFSEKNITITHNLKEVRRFPFVFTIIFLSILMLAGRGTVALLRIPIGSMNIYEQQYQMGKFLNKYYSGQGVAANDIGLINYLADIKCVDLMGLGKSDIAWMIRNGGYNVHKNDLNKILKSKDVKVAIIYSEWFKKLTNQWIPIGEWKIRYNISCFSDTVHFYAIGHSYKKTLQKQLDSFKADLPKSVLQQLY